MNDHRQVAQRREMRLGAQRMACGVVSDDSGSGIDTLRGIAGFYESTGTNPSLRGNQIDSIRCRPALE